MNSEIVNAIEQLEKEKGIDKDYLFDAIETSLVTACKKNFGSTQNAKVIMDRETGDVRVFAEKYVVDEVFDDGTEISLEDARLVNIDYELDDVVDVEVTPRNFGRIAAQTAKQVVVQKIREAEREIVYTNFSRKEKDIMIGIIQRRERKNVMIDLGSVEGTLTPNEQVPNEEYSFNKRLNVYILEVRKTTKGPQIFVSRTHPELIKRLFEREVPEIHDGIVEIKSISREAGSRTKIAVYSNEYDVDAVGACVGQNGNRVNVIVNELQGEKIDIVLWNEDPRRFIAASLSPSKVIHVSVDEENKSARVIVPDYQLSLAIGKEGQNARLAAKLTGYRIDIKSESQAMSLGIQWDEEAGLEEGLEEVFEPENTKNEVEVNDEDNDQNFDDDIDSLVMDILMTSAEDKKE
ncbi:transcription termination factor NusA [Vallitalea okinawensis]|uniref:transcription termination factor NusA n=1 Tax=Vallitalea okinawensis TaxID=2078660 RepID=UPI000CFB931F|nr:transcription termination factor NusA [Vallitalea okinawensis]